MPVAIHRIRDLIIKHLKEEITEDEYQELQSWVHQSEENSVLYSEFTNHDSLEEAIKESYDLGISIRMKIDARLAAANHPTVKTEEAKLVYLLPPERRKNTWIYAAAACLLVLFTGSYFWLTRLSHPALAEHTASPSKNDVAPGSNKAVLTLGNGSTIVLENTSNGNLAVQGAPRVSKDKNLLAYTAATSDASRSGKTPASAIIYNTLTTPRAGQVQLILPDGSKARVDNASSLCSRTAFTGNALEITLNA